jgi:hypothetical protein
MCSASLPYRDRDLDRGEVEAPRTHQGEVIVSPADDALQACTTKRLGYALRQLAGQRRLVDLGQKLAERGDHIFGGDSECGRSVPVQPVLQRTGPGHGCLELLDVLRPHPGQEIQPLYPRWCHTRAARRSKTASWQERRTSYRARAPARPTQRHKAVKPQIVKNRSRVRRVIGNRSRLPAAPR